MRQACIRHIARAPPHVTPPLTSQTYAPGLLENMIWATLRSPGDRSICSLPEPLTWPPSPATAGDGIRCFLFAQSLSWMHLAQLSKLTLELRVRSSAARAVIHNDESARLPF